LEPEPEPSKWLNRSSTVLSFAAVVVPAFATVFSQFVKSPSDVHPVWFAIYAILVASAVVFQYLVARKTKREAEQERTATAAARAAEATARADEETARTLARTKINAVINPIAQTLGPLAVAPSKDKPALQREVLTKTISAAFTAIGGEDKTRSCYFQLNPGPPERLVSAHFYQGRMEKPRREFCAGTPEGDAMIEMVKNGESLICGDVRVNPPPGWPPARERDYRSFIAVAVAAAGKPFGMLTVDSTLANDLDKDDANVLQVLAALLAAALAA
jgi:type II secretory pathway pseudopilin PulG